MFLCHDWENGDKYYRVCGFLDAAPNVLWENLSVPERDPLDTNEMPETNLRDQTHPADVMLVLAGMYSARSDSMDWEIAFARRIGKGIIGSRPWGERSTPIAGAGERRRDRRLAYGRNHRCDLSSLATSIREGHGYHTRIH